MTNQDTQEGMECKIASHIPNNEGDSCLCGYFVSHVNDDINRKDGLYPIHTELEERFFEIVSNIEFLHGVPVALPFDKEQELLSFIREVEAAAYKKGYQDGKHTT